MTTSKIRVEESASLPHLHNTMGGLQPPEVRSLQDNFGDSSHELPIFEALRAQSIYDTAQQCQNGASAQNAEYCYSIDMLHLFD